LVRPAICSAISSAFSEVAKETPVGDFGADEPFTPVRK
jgi:hypothetical protein